MIAPIATLEAELAEARRQQAAVAEIQAVMTKVPGVLQPVLDAIVQAASRLLYPTDAILMIRDGDTLRTAALHGLERSGRVESFPVDRETISGRSVVDQQPVHVHDISAMDDEFPRGAEIGRLLGHRTLLAIPLLTKGDPKGCLLMRRTRVEPFTDRQIQLLATFADQAVIAIENARLFEAERTRTREVEAKSAELALALQYQTAISDILAAISRSPGDLTPVLSKIAATAHRLCGAERAILWQLKDGRVRLAAHSGASPSHATFLEKNPIPLDNSTMAGRAFMTRQVVHISDASTEASTSPVGYVAAGTLRTMLCVPLLKLGEPIGVVSLSKSIVNPFSDSQVQLVTAFADQAVIAIENARLLDELQTRQRELEESLVQQTATAEVLKTISRSAFDLNVVLAELVKSAVTLCSADFGHIRQRQGDLYPVAASHGLSAQEYSFFVERPTVPSRESVPGRAILARLSHRVSLTVDRVLVSARGICGQRGSCPLREGGASGSAMFLCC